MDDTKNVELMTDDELDGVAGGNMAQYQEFESVFKKLAPYLTPEEKKEYGTINLQTIRGFLNEKVGIRADFKIDENKSSLYLASTGYIRHCNAIQTFKDYVNMRIERAKG